MDSVVIKVGDKNIAAVIERDTGDRGEPAVERLCRSVKYEDVYLHAYESPTELRAGLARYFKFYNTKRRHSALDRRTPDAVYFEQVTPELAA